MKQDDQTFSAFLQTLRKRARPATIGALVVLLGMTYFVFELPAVYESYATLLIEQPEVQPEELGGAGSREYVEQRLQRTRQRVLTTDNVQALIERHKLYQEDGDKPTAEDKLASFNGNVVVTPQVTGVVDPRSMRGAELTYAFNVTFRYDDPTIARDVAADLAQLFIASSVAQAKDEAARSIGFLRSEGDRLETDLRAREARLAEFRQKYSGGLPEERESNLRRVSDLERDLARVDDDLRAARAKGELLQAQLIDTPRDRPIIGETGQPMLRGADRLAAAQQELVAALAKYSEDHPDVRKLRREIASLSTEVSSGGTTSLPSNPEYVQLQTQVDAADRAVRELMARRYDLSSTLARLQSAIHASPAYEKDYTDLVRDYELVKAQYQQMRAKQATAETSQKAATASAAEKYVLIDPARIPETPVEPDRPSLMFLAVILSIAAGLGIASLLNATDATIRGSADVTTLLGSAPLGQVPTMRSTADLHRKRLGDVALAGAMLAAIVFAIYSAI